MPQYKKATSSRVTNNFKIKQSAYNLTKSRINIKFKRKGYERKESISENVFIIKIYFYIVFLGSNGTNSSKFMKSILALLL